MAAASSSSATSRRWGWTSTTSSGSSSTLLGGVDSVVVGDLSGTDVTQVIVNLASTIGGTLGDAAIDTVSVQGSASAENVILTSSAGALR